MASTVFERQAPSLEAARAALAPSRLAPFWIDDLPPDAPTYPALAADAEADLVIVGGGFTGLWTAIQAKERDPGRSVVLLEAERIGWAASGRNGGFCEASLTHGEANGQRRWPEEMDTLTRMGLENLDAIEEAIARYGIDAEFERTGSLAVAVEPHQVAWLAEEADFRDADAARALVNSPTYLGCSVDAEGSALVHPAKLAVGLAKAAAGLGVVIHEATRVAKVRPARGGGVTVTAAASGATHTLRARRVALGTNVFPALLRRNALMTVPVYDYSLMTEPLTTAQLKAIGWKGRQGISDVGNQFHYYRLTRDNRILFGGYDAIYHFGGKVRPEYEDRTASYERLASHFLTTFPQLEGITFTHRWAGAIDSCTRFCAFYGLAQRGTVAYATGFTGLGVGASRFAAAVMLDLLDGLDTELTRLRMVRERPLPFPPEPIASIGINLTRWSMDRADHHEGKRNVLLRVLDALGMGFDS